MYISKYLLINSNNCSVFYGKIVTSISYYMNQSKMCNQLYIARKVENNVKKIVLIQIFFFSFSRVLRWRFDFNVTIFSSFPVERKMSILRLLLVTN